MLKELFKYRGLICELAIRDLKLRYRNPFFGPLWMLIIPFSTAYIYKIFFSDFMNVRNTTYPFFIHLMTALLPWNYFTSCLQGNVKSITNNKGIINQISFPKYLFPVSTILANLICFIPGLLVLFIFLIAFKVPLSPYLFLLPLIILLHTFFILGLSLIVSVLEVIYRDIEHIIQILLMALFFLMPAAYTMEELISRANPNFLKWYMLNPLVGILNLYRMTFSGGFLNSLPANVNFFNMFFVPVAGSFFILVGGFIFFNRCQNKFFDYLNR